MYEKVIDKQKLGIFFLLSLQEFYVYYEPVFMELGNSSEFFPTP